MISRLCLETERCHWHDGTRRHDEAYAAGNRLSISAILRLQTHRSGNHDIPCRSCRFSSPGLLGVSSPGCRCSPHCPWSGLSHEGRSSGISGWKGSHSHYQWHSRAERRLGICHRHLLVVFDKCSDPDGRLAALKLSDRNSSILNCFVGNLQQEPLLRVYSSCFLRTHIEEL